MLNRIAEAANILGAFCGMRDVSVLSPECLRERLGSDRADVMVLFGGSILAGGDVLAEAMKRGCAKKYVIVGGEGHTTQTLRDKVHALYPDFDTTGLAEADVFAGYLQRRHSLSPDLAERASTNCGNNITNLLALLEEKGVRAESFILTQDASMQRRMDAGLRRHAPGARIVNFAAYRAEVTVRNGALAFAGSINGMWDMNRYISLLLGEIPRLTDDENGYGPCGKNFIAHTDVPDDVRSAFETLRSYAPALVRSADKRYATR